MSQLLNSYPVFEGNQVLTSSQLNQLVAYLDEQNRVTRAKLIGTGIVCGLELSYNDTVSPITINISKGMGITSQGYLITLADCVVNRYKDYFLPTGVSYPPFEDPQTKTQDIDLYELLTPDYEVLPGEVVKVLDDPSGFLDNKIVMLFIECRDIDLKSCLGQSCDERGMDRVFIVRKLLISKADMDIVLARTCTQTGLFPEQYDLPEIIIRRTLFDPAVNHSTDYFKFSENYISAIRGDKFMSPFATTKTGLFDQLFDALSLTYTDFAAILAPIYGGSNPFSGMPNATWTNFLNGTSAGPKYLGTQYFYDFVKDLILAYNEFRDSAFELMSECCMSMDCFPKHLMLGEAIPVVLTQPSKYRHGFVLSRAFNNQSALLDKVIMLHKRMVIMTRQFNLSIINNPSITPIPPSQLGVPVFITPSNEKRDPLSLRSMPYYYNIHNVEAGLGTLEENWNYEYIRKFLFAKGLTPLGYGNQNIVQNDDQGPIATPLYYNTDPYNFLRIEGAIRQNYVDVTAELEALRNRFDLPFNIVTLRLSGPPLDDITERCDFNDIRTEYGTLRTSLSCMIKNLFDRYATSNGGAIQIKKQPDFVTTLISQAGSTLYFGSVTQPQTGVVSFSAVSTPDGTPGALKLNTAPVYAPQRTMSQAVANYNTNLFQLVSKLNLLNTQFLPFNITDFNFGYTGLTQNSTDGFIQTYLDAVQFAINLKVDINQINDLITHSLKLRNTPELYFDYMLYMREILTQLENFITNCNYKSLTLLNYTFQYRMQYLRDNDQNLFANFIKKHPGIEHAAGVPKGGTYIMVVSGNPVTVNKPSRNFAVAQIREYKNMQVERAILELKPEKSVQDELEIKRIDGALLQTFTVQADLAVAIPIQRYLIEGYQVIADFTLPYLCCCDCECDEIPHPTEISQLGIPAIATPFYAEYNLGDYAFGKDVNYAKGVAQPNSILIPIVPALQYEKNIFDDSQIHLYLIDKSGYKLLPPVVSSREGSFNDLTLMSTFNSPNNPTNTQQYGTVSVRTYTDGRPPEFVYAPFGAFKGVDSFYYMFEIWDNANVPVRRSTMGKVTVNVTG